MNPRQAKKCQRRFSTLVVFGLLVSSLTFVAQVVRAPAANAAASECVKADIQQAAGYITFEIRYSDNPSGCNWTVPAATLSAKVALVGGGGGAGLGWAGGGGGGGQVQFNDSLSVIPGQTFAITIGQGGAKKTTTNRAGNSGGQTAFGTVTALGGGGGGGSNAFWSTSPNISLGMSAQGLAGGSGGGNNLYGTSANGLTNSTATSNSFSGWQSFGNPGGLAVGNGSFGSNATWGAGSGGGGAFEPGSNSTFANGLVTLGKGGRGVWLLDHCLGGGGESNYQGTAPSGITYGSSLTSQQPCVSPDGTATGGTSGAIFIHPATPNTGGGGGGYSLSDFSDYYAGSDGVVIIRYADPAQPVVDLANSSDLGISNSDNLTSDATPTISISNLVAGATASVTATKSGQTNRTCSITSGSSCDLPTLTEGIWTITATQTVSGQTSIVSSGLEITVDTTAPSAPTITSSPSSGTSTSATVAFTGEVGATFECKIDSGSYSSCTSPKTFTGIADGAHTISVRQTDSYGNIGGVATTSSWTVDTTAPSAPTITSSPSSGTSTSATVAFTGEVGATFECKIDSGSYSSCTSPKTFTGLADGAHTFYVKQTDTFGNTGTARTANWTIDSTAPSVAISSASQSNSATPTISGTAEAGSDVTVVVAGATYVTTATNGTWSVNLATATRSSGTLNLNTNGSNSVSVVATDSYGNNSAAVTQSLLIDTVAPSVVSKSSPSTPTNSAELIFTITFSEAVTGLTSTDFNLTGTSCTINTISGSTTVYTIKITNCADGVTVGLELKSNRVEDALSNTGPATDSAFTSVVIDRTAPTVSITSTSSTKVSRPTLSGTTENGAQISILIGSAIYQFTASSSSWSLNLNTSFTSSGTLSLNSNGSNLVTITATDSAGNSATTTQTLLIDTVSPTVSKKDSPRTPSTSLSLTFIVRFSETITGLDASDFFVSGGFCQVTNVTADSGSYLIALTSCVDSKPISLMLQANSVSDTLGNFGPSQNETFTTVYTDTTYVEPVAVAPKNESAKVAEKPVQILKKPEIVKPVDKQLQQKEVQVALMDKLETSDLNFNVKLVSEERQQELVMSPLLITVEKQFFALASVQVEGSTKYVVITTRTPLLNPLVLM